MQKNSCPKQHFPKEKILINSPSGFTLIELLIVIATMVLLFGLGMASYRSFSQRKAVEKVGIQVRNDLLLIQQYALSGKKPSPANPNCENQNFLEGYVFRPGGNSYTIYADCSTGPNILVKTVSLDSSGPSIESVKNLPNCNIYASGSNIGWLEFLTVARGLKASDAIEANDCIRIRISLGSNRYEIFIDSAGAIK